MTTGNSVSLPMQIFGYLILALGLGGCALYYGPRLAYGHARDMGIVLGNGAIVLLGLVTIAAASALRTIERRLRALEAETLDKAG
jgi:hypothetical protein